MVHWAGIYLQRKIGERGIPALIPLHQTHSTQKTSVGHWTPHSSTLPPPPSPCLMVLNEREEGMKGGESKVGEGRMRQRSRRRGQPIRGVSPPQPGSHISTAQCGPCLSPGKSGSDGGDLCALSLAHYVGNEVQQPGGAFVLRGLPLSFQASGYL